MSRKVFVSLLGTGFYEKAVYVHNESGFKSSETRFIQQATLEFNKCKEWDSNDIALILLTDKARETNWDKSIQTRFNRIQNAYVPYPGLEALIDGMGLPFKAKDISIPDGKDEKEMWDIFNIMFNELEEGDELYFDLTHSFRYLPMLILVLGSYAKFLKNITVASITYGNYEAKDSENNAPIVDLLPLSALQDWTFAAGQYLRNGNVSNLVELSKREITPILRDPELRDESTQHLNNFLKTLDTVIKERVFCRGLAIAKSDSLRKAKDFAAKLETTVIQPLNPIFDKIKGSLDGYDTKENIYNVLQAAQWCHKFGYYQQALTLLHEFTITYVCSRHEVDAVDKDCRDTVAYAYEILSGCAQYDEYKGNKTDFLNELLEDEFLQSSVSDFRSMKDKRNDYNHSGIRKFVSSINSLQDDINKALSSFKDVVSKTWPVTWTYAKQDQQDKRRVFVNLSNHPSSNWSAKQLEAAEAFGEIMDIPFPSVSSSSTSEEIDKLSEEFVAKVLSLRDNGAVVTVHVMGEMTLTFAIVSRLQKKGVTCVASTSERLVRELGDGKKEIQFCFQQFRQY